MKRDLPERIRVCIAIETGIADIYREFMVLFPQAMDLWGKLAMEEENHAAVLAIGSRYADLGKLPDYIVPESLPNMRNTLDLVTAVKRTLKSGGLSLKEALEISLRLEQTLEESYMIDVMTRETESEIVERLQRLMADTKSHITTIKEYMKTASLK